MKTSINVNSINSLPALLAANPRKMVLAYSGGLDGSYLLAWCQQHGIQVHAVNIGLVPNLDYSQAQARAEAFGASFVHIDALGRFCEQFVDRLIVHNGKYNGAFPISSSASRPLIAALVAEEAQRIGADYCAHTATHMQNSARRFERAFFAVAPEVNLCAPFLESHLSREDKAKYIAEQNRLSPKDTISVDTSKYSVDENLWARVIENDSLENPENTLPLSGVFEWTCCSSEAPAVAQRLIIGFEHGRPVQLNGQKVSIKELLIKLNAVGGQYGIGRSSGLEETALGVKNHEVREAPAAELLIQAHTALQNAILTDQELCAKQHWDQQWTQLVAAGHWFSDLAEALDRASSHLDELLNGEVTLKLTPGRADLDGLSAPVGLCYMGFEDDYLEMASTVNFSAKSYFDNIALNRRSVKDH